jgi:peroxiredoxin Q/BCP
MLKVGDKLPQFEGTNQDGETISSSKLIGKS